MRLLVTGSRGQLGRALEKAAPVAGHELVGVDLPELDIRDPAAVAALVATVRPEAVINCAAFTAVDAAEGDEAAALAVNGTAVGHLADAVNTVGATLVQVSTDYVFDGESRTAYVEDDPPNPLSAYGRTKLAGELAARRAHAHLIVRTAWLFGEGNNFVEAIRRQIASGGRELRVVDDQTGCPTYAADLAVAIIQLLARGAAGCVHAVNAGSTTWCSFAREIVARLGADVEVVPVSTAEMPRPARRPRRSVLDTASLVAALGSPLPPWQDALARYLGAGGSSREGARRGVSFPDKVSQNKEDA
jgi:dTDP-4-dehydrorhamnose reductase